MYIYIFGYNLLKLLIKNNLAGSSLIYVISKLPIAIMAPSQHPRGAIETTMGSIKAIN